ncbi:radical SAM protein [Streptomyces sp. URMC 129]|uniref:radical SAM protein n=1 Tax=Streptomyces sp. URMC 129 TaxID=3423407 RepID=UPI003F1D7410
MTAITGVLPAERDGSQFLWLDLTRKCQLACVHCYNASGPDGGHGTMTREDWIALLDQAADCGVDHVQFIGGEPTTHPHAAELVGHALGVGLRVEVFSNLVRVTDQWWELFRREGVTLATSYYSDRAEEHDAMTGRRSHARTRANIEKAIGLGIPLRVGIIGNSEQRIAAAKRDLEALGVTRIGADHVRAFGRGGQDQAPDPGNLCGRCGAGRAAIGPNGDVSPCVFSGWMNVGNIQDAPLAAILGSAAMTEANATIRSAVRTERKCRPDKDKCYPDQTPCFPAKGPCRPDQSPPTPCSPQQQCNPGHETDRCFPDGY